MVTEEPEAARYLFYRLLVALQVIKNALGEAFGQDMPLLHSVCWDMTTAFGGAMVDCYRSIDSIDDYTGRNNAALFTLIAFYVFSGLWMRQ